MWLNLAAQRTPNQLDTSTYDPPPEILREVRSTLHSILIENILPFWYPQCIDEENGGYRINHDLQGRWKGNHDKHLVSQSRTLWFFARLLNSDYRSPSYEKAARHGFEFLRDRLWDQGAGGFYWEVDFKGTPTKHADKHLYGQAFALYAVSEYAIATGDPEPSSLAGELFDLLEQHAHDTVNGGYREFFGRSWQPADTGSTTYMGTPPDFKHLNTHLHLLEALTRYAHLARTAAVHDRLVELILIQSSTVLRKDSAACTDVHLSDWTPSLSQKHARVTYGHDLENIWFLIEACEAAGLSQAPFLDLYGSLFATARRFGFDPVKGGFYYFGPLRRHAVSKVKIWWVQAEALVATLHMYRLTRRASYFEAFRQTLDWVVHAQIDWDNSEWHRRIMPNGSPSGDKAGDQDGNAWKTPYHNGRAMINCLEAIDELISGAGNSR